MDEQVLRLEVPVQDAVGVAELRPRQELVREDLDLRSAALRRAFGRAQGSSWCTVVCLQQFVVYVRVAQAIRGVS